MSRYTEKLILQTFGEMLDEMPFDKITVSALTRRSDISHNTFYYHYNDIYELLEIWIRRELSPFFGEERSFSDWKSAMTAMLRRWQSDARRIYHVFDSLSREQVERHVYEQAAQFFLDQIRMLPGADALTEEQLLRISDYARYLFFGFLMRFLWDKMQDDVESAVHDLSVLLSSFVTHAIEDARAGKI